MRELSTLEIDEVSGAISDDAAYGASVGVSAALLVGAVAAAPILAVGGIALLAGGSIVASSLAIYYAIQ